MAKIPLIKEMEDFLLQDSMLQDIKCMDRLNPVQANQNQKMTQDQVRREISILSRILIRAYVGWPVHDDIVKRKVLVYLTKLYKNADDMTVGEFADNIRKITLYIPDNHLTIANARIKKRNRKCLDVGKNIAGDKTFYATLHKDNIAIIAFSTMSGSKQDKELLDDFIKKHLNTSSALIIDLRGNGGGDNINSDNLATYLCGKYIDNAKKTFVRTTPEAKWIQQKYKPKAEWAKIPESEKMMLFVKGQSFTINKKTAYMKPIYILTDSKTGSSAEMFLLRMLHHPMVTVIGDNSRGMEVYGCMAQTYLPISKLIIRTGMHYRILEYNNFELHGYKPDIKCKDGQDAFYVALSKYANQLGANQLTQSKQK
ncbi:MAG: hypothetical protein J6W08_01560 [Alphaproteobacteria bacterium]|nr:hypothetical protein [Alphaproteobacteria bacterium]